MTWMLRRASGDDLAAIMTIERETFVHDAWSEDSMRSELAGAHSYYLVAEGIDGGRRIAGYAGLLAPRGSGEADVQTIAVDAAARRRGLGRTLMLALLAEARRRGARRVFLEVRADNEGAQALYRSLGFEAIGRRPGYYQPEGVDAVTMCARLSAPTTIPAERSGV